MLDVKKKLSSFLHSSARAQLQNVLTVEWDTHKTVLVQVPGAAPRGDMEMEMGGMDRGAARDNYGRLADDDEEHEALFNQSSFDASHARWKANTSSSSSTSLSGSGSGSGRDMPSTSITRARAQAPPPLAPRPYGYAAENPFDETSAYYRATMSHSAWGYDSSRRQQAPGTPEQGGKKGWATFDDDGRNGSRAQGGGGAKSAAMNPWGAGGEWSSSQTTSPTSSRGTRESDMYETEDPFR